MFNVDRLVNNLCTIWVGQFKLHANKARFQRATLNKGQGADHKKVANSSRPNSGDSGSSNSYVNAEFSSVKSKEDSAIMWGVRLLIHFRGKVLLGRAKVVHLVVPLTWDKKSVNDFEDEKLNEDDEIDDFLSLYTRPRSKRPIKDSAKELCVKNKVNFLAIQETKMEEIDFSVFVGVGLDAVIDKGKGTGLEAGKKEWRCCALRNIDHIHSMDLAQKAKIKWSIEGDENSNFFHGILNKKRNQMNIRGITIDGVWKEQPNDVKQEFLSHFQDRFVNLRRGM
ncbi:hypothetical protein Tco_0360227 [Tanacetum coccineum]